MQQASWRIHAATLLSLGWTVECSEQTGPIVNKSALPGAEEQEHRRSQPADETATASTSGQDEKGAAGEGKEQQKAEEQLADHELHQIGTFAQVGCAIWSRACACAAKSL